MIIAGNKALLNPLVCDTNIWYDIADGKISVEKIKKYNLIGTGVNIAEFSATRKMVKDPDKYSRTLKAMLKYHSLIFKDYFLDHILAQFYEDHEIDSTKNDNILEKMLIYMSIDPFKDISDGNYQNTWKHIIEYENLKNEMADSINNRLPLLRDEIKSKEGEENYAAMDLTSAHRNDISNMVEYYAMNGYNKVLKISVEDQKWERLDFFMQTWDKFFRKVVLTKNMKVKGNDFGDLFNLVYVQPGVRYSTRERKWKNLFKSDVTLSEYFIEL